MPLSSALNYFVSYLATVFTLFDGTIARCPGTNTQFSSTSPSTASCVAEHGWLGNQVIGDQFEDERGFEFPSSVPGGISMDHFLRSLIQPSTRRRWRCGGLKSLVNPGEVCTDTAQPTTKIDKTCGSTLISSFQTSQRKLICGKHLQQRRSSPCLGICALALEPGWVLRTNRVCPKPGERFLWAVTYHQHHPYLPHPHHPHHPNHPHFHSYLMGFE